MEVKKWQQEKKIYGEKINIGATEDEIEIFLKEAKIELNVDLPNDYANRKTSIKCIMALVAII